MRSLWLLLTLLCGLAQAAPPAPITVVSRTMAWRPASEEDSTVLTPDWIAGSIKLPWVSAGPAGVAARINDGIFLQLLGMAAPRQPGPRFTPPPHVAPDGIVGMDFQVQRNDGRVLSIEVHGDSMGAYPETFAYHLNFDAHTGQALQLADLLTPQGLTEASRRMVRERLRRYTEEIQHLRQAQRLMKARKGSDQDAIDQMDDRIALYEGCVATERKAGYRLLGDLSFRNDRGLVLNAGRCSPHVTAALDDLVDIDLPLTTASLQPWLTPYGRALLLGDGTPPAQPSPRTLSAR